MPIKDIKNIVNDDEWQALRQSFIGTWSTKKDENVSRLRGYLGKKPWGDKKKLQRVMNYLTGTAFRIGKITSPGIQNLRNEVSAALKELKDE